MKGFLKRVLVLAILLATCSCYPTTKPLPIPEVQTGNAQVGYVIVTPDSGTNTPTGTVTYGRMEYDGSVLAKAGVLATPLTTSASGVVEFLPSINRSLGVNIANPNAAANTITLTLKDENGTVVGSPVNLTLDPYKQIARFVSELFPGVLGESFIGTINLQSSMPFAPLGLAFTGGTFSTIAMGESTSTSSLPTRSLNGGTVPDTPKAGTIGGAGSIIFPQFVYGGAWATQIGLLNSGNTTATGRIDVFSFDGTPLAVKLNGSLQSTFTYSIQAGGTVIFAPRDSNGQSPL